MNMMNHMNMPLEYGVPKNYSILAQPLEKAFFCFKMGLFWGSSTYIMFILTVSSGILLKHSGLDELYVDECIRVYIANFFTFGYFLKEIVDWDELRMFIQVHLGNKTSEPNIQPYLLTSSTSGNHFSFGVCL